MMYSNSLKQLEKTIAAQHSEPFAKALYLTAYTEQLYSLIISLGCLCYPLLKRSD